MAKRSKVSDVVSMDGHVVAGYEARRIGLHFEACPHGAGPEATAWMKGWQKCHDELKEKAGA